MQFWAFPLLPLLLDIGPQHCRDLWICCCWCGAENGNLSRSSSVETLFHLPWDKLFGLVFGLLLHTGRRLRNGCILISSPEGVHMLSAVSPHSAWRPLVGLRVDPFRASGTQDHSLQGSSNLQMFYPLPSWALLLLPGSWSNGAGLWPLNQHLNLLFLLFLVCRWLLFLMGMEAKVEELEEGPTQPVFSQILFFRSWAFGKIK